MVEIYYYLPSNEVSNVVDCGMKLSKWFDKEVSINGLPRKCISALLNPKDDITKYKSKDFKCIKFEVASNYCFVADKNLYQLGKKFPEAMELYNNSVIPIDEYTFGLYRLPECLVASTIIAEQISVLNKRLDSPVLFNNSEDLYINNIIEENKEIHNDFNDCLLYNFYCKLAEIGKIDKIEDDRDKLAVFIDRKKGKAFTIKVPDISLY